jgi:pimeloyl-ACP methyl ester carboxylesterase
MGTSELLLTNTKDHFKDKPAKVNKNQLKLVQFGFRTLGYIFPNIAAWKAYRIFSTPRVRARHRKPDTLIQEAKMIDFPFKRINLKLYEWGNGNRIILLAHGWESRGTALRSFIPSLVENGFKVVAFDAPGHGDSGGSWNNLANNASAIVSIIQYYSGIEGIIGHSFGCSSSIHALQFVDTTISVNKVVFVAVPNSIKEITDGYIKMIQAPKLVKRRFVGILERISKQPIESLNIANAHNSVKIGKLLLVHDRFDQITSIAAAEAVVNKWENAHLLITEGFGHFRLVKNQEVITRVADFFK